jgi:plastocyanin
MRSIVRFGGVLAAVVLLAACGGGDTGGDTGGGGGGAATTLTMVDNEFQPADLTVSAGTELQLSNEGQAGHTFTIPDGGIDEQVEPGQSSSTTIDLEAGTYDFVCEFHESAGMTGTLTVE